MRAASIHARAGDPTMTTSATLPSSTDRWALLHSRVIAGRLHRIWRHRSTRELVAVPA